MKKIFRILCPAVFCVLIFCFAAFCTAQKVSAAEKISPETGSILLTMNTGAVSGDADSRVIRLLNIPADFTERYTSRWTSADESVATVSPAGEVRAVSSGETMVRCEISRVSTGKHCATVTVNVTVQEGGGGAAIIGFPDGNTMSVGDSYALHRNKDERLGVSSTDRTVWEVSDPDVAVVDGNGVVTALAEGSFTVWARTYDAYGALTAVSSGVTIEVAAGLGSVKQLSANSVEVTFVSAMTDFPEDGDFTIKEEDGTLLGIKSVTEGAGGRSAVIETFAPFHDGDIYTVAVSGCGSMQFEASHGEVEKVEVLTTRIEAGEKTKIEYALLDDAGGQRYKGSETEDVLVDGDRVELVSSDDDAWIDGMELTIYDLDATAAVTVRYYPTGEGTYVESAPVIIRAVEDTTTVTSVTSYTVTQNSDGSAADWDAVQTYVHIGDSGWYLQLSAKDSEGNRMYTDAWGDDGWYFTSENPEILGIDSDTGHLTPFRQGTASIYCLHNEFEYCVNITVKAERTPSGVQAAADKTTLSVAGNTDTASVTVQITDAAGVVLAADAENLTWQFTSGAEPHPVVAVTDTEAGIFVTVTASDATGAGQHVLELSYGAGKTALTFTVSQNAVGETTDVTGGVLWYAADAVRPASVTLTLYADGVSTASADVTAADGWQHTWTDLPTEQGGKTVTYTVKAAAPAGFFVTGEDNVTTAIYTAEITGASAQTDGSGNVTLTVTFSGSLSFAEAAGISVSGGTVQSASLSGNTLVLNMGALQAGTYTVSGSGIYGAASVTVAAG